MRLWLASANLKLIAQLAGPGIFAGVITNPQVVALSNCGNEQLARELICITKGSVFIQVRTGSVEGMLAEAELLAALSPGQMIVKIPATEAGLTIMPRLAAKGIRVAATCLPEPALAVIAEAAGAQYIIPWASMMEKRGLGDRTAILSEMQEILGKQRSQCSLIVGAYQPEELSRLAKLGIPNSFIWEKDIHGFLHSDLAAEAASSFQESWRKIDDEHY
jgi:transaldolase